MVRSFSFQFSLDSNPPDEASSSAGIGIPLPILESNFSITNSEVEEWQLGVGETMQVFQSTPITCAEQIEEATFQLYERILGEHAIQRIYRIWNFIPDINAPFGEFDHYMKFCQGRADLLRAHGHPDSLLSAASALGYLSKHWRTGDAAIIAVVMTGPATISPLENPNQIPAYQYPEIYGPRSPSFARAAMLEEQRLLVSGTASILRSESQHLDDPFAQACLAAENVQILFDLARSQRPGLATSEQLLRIYVRHAEQWPEIRAGLAQKFDLEIIRYIALQAQICRPELLVEIEFSTS